MVKIVRTKVKGDNRIRILTPDVSVQSYLKRKGGYSYLKLFSSVAHNQFMNEGDNPNNRAENQHNTTILMLGVDQHFAAMSRLQKIADRKFLTLPRDTRKRNIKDYLPEQEFIGLVTAYLNSVFVVRDLAIKIDKIFHTTYSNQILWNKDNYNNIIQIRNLLVHEAIPFVFPKDQGYVLDFSWHAIKKLRRNRWSEQFIEFLQNERVQSDTRIQLALSRPRTHQFRMEAGLNAWAKKYLEGFDQDQEVEIVTRVERDGGMTKKKYLLSGLIEGVKPAPLLVSDESEIADGLV